MRFGIRTIDEFNVQGKTVLCRIDINQPIDRGKGLLKSTERIKACVPTLKELSGRGAKLVLMAHQGSDIEYKNFFTTRPHAAVLSDLLNRKVEWVEDVCGPLARTAIAQLQPGDILLLDNVRFCSEEQTLFETNLCLTHEQQARTQVVSKLAPLGDLYVCDAFAAAHRDQPTLCGFEELLPSAMGRLFEKEYCVISGLMEQPVHPCVYVLGGSKVADAFLMIETVLKSGSADEVLTGGLVGQILLAAKGEGIGSETLSAIKKAGYASFIESSRAVYERYKDRIHLPTDLAFIKDGQRAEAGIGVFPADACAMDIGSETAKRYVQIILKSKTVFMNGPLGVFENQNTEFGTKSVMEAIGNTGAYTVVGGGDSITAASKYSVLEKISYVCTGGGALIRFLTGEELPVVKALRHAAEKFTEKPEMMP